VKRFFSTPRIIDLLTILVVGFTLPTAAAQTNAPLRPGEAPPALSVRAVEFFRLVQARQWDGAAAFVSEQSHRLFDIPGDAQPEVVLTHTTFNPGRILQLELTPDSWFHLAPAHRSPSYRMEILLHDEDYHPEMILIWILEGDDWRLLCDTPYRRYLDQQIPGNPRGRCIRFMGHLRHGQWVEAAALISSRTANLPFSPPEPGPKELAHALTFVPGKDTFKTFVLTFDRNSRFEIGQYNEGEGWFEMRLEQLTGAVERLSLLWVREEGGEWKVFCDADYLRYLDLEPPEQMPPALARAVERYHESFCKGFNRKWWEDFSDRALWRAYDLGSEKLQALVPFPEFATFPDLLPVPRFRIKYQRIAGFARRENELVEVVVVLRGGGPGARKEAPATSQWIKQGDGGWRRTTAEAEFAQTSSTVH